MTKFSKDYHDYVFKDGRLVGDFEKMYRHSAEVPWHQDKTAHMVFSNIDLAILQQYQYDDVCEIGCGLGYFTHRLHQELHGVGVRVRVTGIDISETAITTALARFPEIRFAVGDLTKERPLPGTYFDLVILKEVIWYICHRLTDFLANARDMVRAGGFMYVSQSFPESDRWIFQEVIDSPETLKKMFCEFLEPLFYCVEWDWRYNGRPLVHLLGRFEA